MDPQVCGALGPARTDEGVVLLRGEEVRATPAARKPAEGERFNLIGALGVR
jgi:hypothetical protein